MSNIVITISKNGIQGANGQAQEPPVESAGVGGKPKGAGQGSDLQQKAINTALVQAGKQALNYAVSQYGNFTGDYLTANALSNMVEIAGYIGTIAVAGPVVGGIAVATQVTLKMANYSFDKAKANRQADYILKRSGNITKNGGRGTND